MTLKQLMVNVNQLAINEKIINFAAAGNDIYALNGLNVDGYPILFTCPAGRHLVNDNTTSYSVTLFYIDRLLDDHSNDIEVFSTAIEQLKNLILKIDDLEGVLQVKDGYYITNFETDERLNDRCGGAYAEVEIVTNNTYCPE